MFRTNVYRDIQMCYGKSKQEVYCFNSRIQTVHNYLNKDS